MRFLKLTTLSFFLIGIAGPRSFAQGRNEVGFSVGAGSLQVDPGGGATVVSSFAYQLHLSRHFSIESVITPVSANTSSASSMKFASQKRASLVHSFHSIASNWSCNCMPLSSATSQRVQQ